jgi:hypothetical protein
MELMKQKSFPADFPSKEELPSTPTAAASTAAPNAPPEVAGIAVSQASPQQELGQHDYKLR